MNVQQISDLYEIQRLKSRYFFYLDTGQWDTLRALFVDDVEVFNELGPLPESTEPTVVGADTLVSYLSSSGPAKLTVHHGHMPDIEFVDDDTATGRWAMFGWSDDPVQGFATKMYGHYHDEYARGGVDGQWRIASMHITQLRRNSVGHQLSEQGPFADPAKMRSGGGNSTAPPS